MRSGTVTAARGGSGARLGSDPVLLFPLPCGLRQPAGPLCLSVLTYNREVVIVSRVSGCWKDGLGVGLVHSKRSIQGSYYEVGVDRLLLRRRKLRF